MNHQRTYPDTPAGPFRPPPTTISDTEGAEVDIERLDPENAADREQLQAMYEDFNPADRAQGLPPVRPAAIRTWLETIIPAGPDIIARLDDRIVGHATLVDDGTGGYELAIFVHQDFQGRGIGTAVIHALLGAAAADGIERVWLTVERWNGVAIRLYESVGFSACGHGNFERAMTIRLAPSA